MWDRIVNFWAKTNRWHRAIALFILIELKLIPGGHIGFYCNDPALSHPFTGDTISWKWLFGTTIFLPLVVMLLVERSNKSNANGKEQALFWYKEYLFGLILNLVIVELLKKLVGAPRPHFFDTCSPVEATTCKDSEYVASYTCTKSYWLSTSDRSFPSGHTSLGVHAGVFIAYYLYRRLHNSSKAVLFQSLSVGSSVVCAISRLIDHRHHWWDVLTGALIAIPILLYTTHSLCRNFDCPNRDKENQSDLNNGQNKVCTTENITL